MLNFIKNLFKQDFSNHQKINITSNSKYLINLEQILNQKILVFGESQTEAIKNTHEYLIKNYPDMLNAFTDVNSQTEKVEALRQSLEIFVEEVKPDHIL